MKTFPRCFPAIAVLMLAGCAVGPDFKPPMPKAPVN
jgi:uncharacterized lipoprotein YajG